MLEAEIKTLNEQLLKVNDNLEIFNETIQKLFDRLPLQSEGATAYAKEKAMCAEPDTPASAPKKRATKKKAEPAEDSPTETVSIDDLQRFVLNLVREKRHLRDKIKDLVQEITGAKFMHDVPVDKAGELKAAIEKLAKE